MSGADFLFEAAVKYNHVSGLYTRTGRTAACSFAAHLLNLTLHKRGNRLDLTDIPFDHQPVARNVYDPDSIWFKGFNKGFPSWPGNTPRFGNLAACLDQIVHHAETRQHAQFDFNSHLERIPFVIVRFIIPRVFSMPIRVTMWESFGDNMNVCKFRQVGLCGAAALIFAGIAGHAAGQAAVQVTPTPGGPVYLGGGAGSSGGDAAGPSGPVVPADSVPPGMADGQIEVLVTLSGPSAGEVYAFARRIMSEPAAQAAAEAYRARIDAAQQALLPLLTGPEIQAVIAAQVQWTVNGVILNVNAARLPLIRQLPGVEAVWPLRAGVLTGSGGDWQPTPSDSVMPVAPDESAVQ